jgi:phage terminase large subunit GpA-like protein
MSTNDPTRRDARHCPRCGAMGILPLEQLSGDHGEIQDPVMICPGCNEEFRATGMRWLGVFNVAEMTDEEIDAWAAHFVDAVLGDAVEQESEPG